MKYTCELYRAGLVVDCKEDIAPLKDKLKNPRYYEVTGKRRTFHTSEIDFGHLIGLEYRVTSPVITFKTFRWYQVIHRIKSYFVRRKMIRTLKMKEI